VDDAPEEIVGIALTPCISRKEEAEKIGATVPIAENFRGPKKSPRIVLQAPESEFYNKD
jgi:hypothetical protein